MMKSFAYTRWEYNLHVLTTCVFSLICSNLFVSEKVVLPGTNKILNTEKNAGPESMWQLSVKLIIQRNQNMLIVIILKIRTQN